jgi:hypothetical protein
MRERPGPVTPPKFGPMQGSPGSAEADERVEGLVDEMQRWAQSGELKVEEGQEEWKRAHDARQGRPAAAIPQSTPRRQNTSPFNTGEPPQGTLHARSITFEFTQYDQPTWTILSGPGTFKHTRRASDGGAVATPPPNPSPVRGRGNSQGVGRPATRSQRGNLLLSAGSQRGPDEHPGLAGNRRRGTRGGRGRG